MLRAPWVLLGTNSRGLFVGISTQLIIDLVFLIQANTNSDHEPDVACHGQPKHILLFSKRNFKPLFSPGNALLRSDSDHIRSRSEDECCTVTGMCSGNTEGADFACAGNSVN